MRQGQDRGGCRYNMIKSNLDYICTTIEMDASGLGIKIQGRCRAQNKSERFCKPLPLDWPPQGSQVKLILQLRLSMLGLAEGERAGLNPHMLKPWHAPQKMALFNVHVQSC